MPATQTVTQLLHLFQHSASPSVQARAYQNLTVNLCKSQLVLQEQTFLSSTAAGGTILLAEVRVTQ